MLHRSREKQQRELERHQKAMRSNTLVLPFRSGPVETAPLPALTPLSLPVLTPLSRESRELRLADQADVEKRAQNFRESPAGRARTARERGDLVFQFQLDVRDATTYTIPMGKTGATTTTSDASDVLNSIGREGWRLITGSFVSQATASPSRDRFLAPRQHLPAQGVVGYYLFERNAELHAIA